MISNLLIKRLNEILIKIMFEQINYELTEKSIDQIIL